MEDNKSEVARLRLKIEQEIQSAWTGLHGLAEKGKHEFVHDRFANVDGIQNELVKLIGETEALNLICEVYNSVSDRQGKTGN